MVAYLPSASRWPKQGGPNPNVYVCCIPLKREWSRNNGLMEVDALAVNELVVGITGLNDALAVNARDD